jgi:hypothetical protein
MRMRLVVPCLERPDASIDSERMIAFGDELAARCSWIGGAGDLPSVMRGRFTVPFYSQANNLV